MNKDYGRRARRRMSPGMKISLGSGIGLCVAIAGYFLTATLLRDRANDAADAAAYGASGPPCPVTTPARLKVEGPQLRHTFTYGEMSLSHAFGEADCAWIKEKGQRYPICRFTSPGSLGVKRGKVELLFAPGIGRDAAILRRGDAISCLMTPRAG